MRGRGLSVDIDASDFAAFLRSVNYYRFTGYAIPFQVDREHFAKDAKASDILALYHYDRKLRDLLFEALEVIELNFRTIFAHEAARVHGPLGYLDAANFTDAAKHAKAVTRLQDEFDRSKEKCVLHFKANYANPPVWSVVEIASFGALVHFFRMMQPSDQNKIATTYGYQGNYTASYIQHLCVLRNLCAHHGRLYDHQWDYRFAALPEWKGLAVPKMGESRRTPPLTRKPAPRSPTIRQARRSLGVPRPISTKQAVAVRNTRCSGAGARWAGLF